MPLIGHVIRNVEHRHQNGISFIKRKWDSRMNMQTIIKTMPYPMLRNFASIIFFTRFMTLSCYIVMLCIHNASNWELLCRDLFVCIGPSSLIAYEWPPSGKSDFSKFIHSRLFWQPATSAYSKQEISLKKIYGVNSLMNEIKDSECLFLCSS